jgi:hypothetical protein
MPWLWRDIWYTVSVIAIQLGPLGYFTNISTTTSTTPVVSALRNYYIQSFLEVPAGVLDPFWIQVAVSELKRPLRNRFGSGTVKKL